MPSRIFKLSTGCQSFANSNVLLSTASLYGIGPVSRVSGRPCDTCLYGGDPDLDFEYYHSVAEAKDEKQ